MGAMGAMGAIVGTMVLKVVLKNTGGKYLG